LIPLLPAFCIGAAILFVEILHRVRFKRIAKISLTTAIAGILVFGIVTTSVLITRDVNSNYFEGASFVSKYLENNYVSFKKNNLTLISDAFYLWILQYVFHLPGIYKTYFDNALSNNQMSILVVDPGFLKVMHENSKQGKLLHSIYNSNNTRNIASFRENQSNQNMSIYLFEPKHLGG
jgi:hypothetical protein